MKSVFIASSRKYYDFVREIKKELDFLNVRGFYPYFDKCAIENDFEEKKNATLGHFPEIDQIDVLYVVAVDGYVGYSVTIEIAYAYAKGKEIISSEPIKEFAVASLVSKIMDKSTFIKFVST